MQHIQDQALATYQRNINYLQKKQPHILQLLNIFDRAIQNGDYKERYTLEYINENFDILDTTTNTYLYETKSTEISKAFVEQLNFDKQSSTLEGIPLEYVPQDMEYTDLTQSRKGLHPIMRYYIDNTIHKKLTTAKQLRKYIFLGTGLGLHIPLIHQKIKALNYLIIEDNIEFFKLSLFTTDYASIAAEANLYFSIASSKEEFMQLFSRFMQESFFDNRFIKYTHFGIHSHDKLNYMQHIIASNKIVMFSYRSILSKLLRPLEYINDGSYMLNLAKKFQNTPFETKPILLLAAGPSLHKNIAWVKQNKDKFIILAVSATLPILYKHNIQPDILTHIDGYEAASIHFQNIDTENFLKDTIAIFGSFTPMSVRKLFKCENIFTTEDPLSEYFSGFKSVPTACVGSFSFNLALQFNTKELYTLGLDLALDQETGATHAEGHAQQQTISLDREDFNETISLRKNKLTVPGNFLTEVITTSVFYVSIEAINSFIQEAKSQEQTIYNLSDGVAFVGTKAIKPSEVKLEQTLHKQQLHPEIHQALVRYSQKEMSEKDIKRLTRRLEASGELKSLIDASFANKKYVKSDLFIYALSQLYVTILQSTQEEKKHLAYVYRNFLEYLLPIVVDYFNTQGLKSPKRDIKQLQKMISQELYTIESIHSQALKQFLQSLHKTD